MYTQSPVRSSAGSSHGSSRSYQIGFILSLILTFIPFGLAMYPLLSRPVTLWTVVIAAGVQVVAHLAYFLHLNTSDEQRWNRVALFFSVIIILLMVGLSLWIMDSIHHNMLAH
ncbi:MAG: cyoD 1 [Pseudomonas sp.]|jgi:cytochrome o ubiquinol oxidase operon protein cyoD|uniref:cytochrome o ubiquinol oxidase subunit IV n=1 Tax=Pseudomonas sp. TaxID=306 RepID=UPI002631F797|nr:cytochrome o ubiquinol oxidase subunit IV [Pseudomonas sp.]MDB6052026.1 cyoD 1 [Pseudomonas sp.]